MLNIISTISLRNTKRYTVNPLLEIMKEELDVNILSASYIIGVINLSGKCLTIAGTRRIGGSDAEWRWTPIPKTCRNCTTSYEQCFNEKRYSAIMSTDCNSPPFELFVGYAIGDNEVQGGVLDIK